MGTTVCVSNGGSCLKRAVYCHGLTSDYDKPFDSPPMHEVVFTDKRQTRQRRSHAGHRRAVIDYGFHPMTIYFPLIVQGAMLIEPTESSRQARVGSVYPGDAINREGSCRRSRIGS